MTLFVYYIYYNLAFLLEKYSIKFTVLKRERISRLFNYDNFPKRKTCNINDFYNFSYFRKNCFEHL